MIYRDGSFFLIKVTRRKVGLRLPSCFYQHIRFETPTLKGKLFFCREKKSFLWNECAFLVRVLKQKKISEKDHFRSWKQKVDKMDIWVWPEWLNVLLLAGFFFLLGDAQKICCWVNIIKKKFLSTKFFFQSKIKRLQNLLTSIFGILC